MRTVLDQRNEFTLCRVTPHEAFDYAAIGTFAEASWKSDYAGRVRFVYDEAYFRWFLGGDDWTGLVVLDRDARVVACVFSLYRTICCYDDVLAATYSTGLTVGEKYRGMGFAKWLSDWQRTVLFDEHSRRVSFSMFQTGHGGLGAVHSSGQRQGNIGMLNFHQSPLWGRRLLGQATQPADSGLESLRWSQCCLDERGSLDSVRGTIAANSMDLTSYTAWIAASANLAFLPSLSSARLYLSRDCSRSGTLLYELDSGLCVVTYSRSNTAIDEFRMGEVANVQLVCARSLGARDIGLALRHACSVLQDDGCIGVSILDQGTVPLSILEAEGFAPTNDTLIFSLRGRPSMLSTIPDVRLPVYLDFL